MASEVASKSDKLDHNMLSLRWNTMKQGVYEGGEAIHLMSAGKHGETDGSHRG